MTRRSQGGLVLMILLIGFIIRCSLSVGFFGKHPAAYEQLLSPEEPTVRVIYPIQPAASSPGGLRNLSSLNSSSSLRAAYLPSTQVAQAHPKIEPVWGSLSTVLTRSDVSKDGKISNDEGLQAWKQLKEIMETEANKRASDGSLKGFDRQCPYSMSTLNGTIFKKKNSTLPIPCGLVLDSSITILGTPKGNTGQFSIELVGSKLLREAHEPIVLHYRVHMRGDALTDSPVIVQNTWTSDDDWHQEQRCPPPNSSDEPLVDGLELCNAQIGKNLSRKGGGPGRWLELNHGGSLKSWFPFAEGFPFAATLWAGWQGFHMSVNGKHVTSFEYHQSLEPWMVTGMHIKGSMEPSSVIVNGLPISEDASLVPDLKVISAPKLIERAEMLIGVFSTSNNFVRRMAVRRTWMQYPHVRNGSVVVRFFVGLHQNEQVNKELWNEAATYGDMQLLPLVDYYNVIMFKTLAICIYAIKNLKAKYVMKTDDDTFVRVDAVLFSIYQSERRQSLLLGNIEFSNKPNREIDSKWYITFEEWAHPTFPPWAHGPAYVISVDIAQFVVEGHEKKTLKFFKLEDVAMGMWVQQFKLQKRKRVDYVNDEQFCHSGCDLGYTTAHYQNPGQMQCLWNHVMLGDAYMCCNLDGQL